MTGAPARFGAFVVLAAFALLAADVWLSWNWLDGREALQLDGEQLANCNALAKRISELRSAPARVEETARTSAALARLIESAAQQAGLPTDRIVHVSPGEPRRIGDSPYLEQSTAVELRAITLQQLIELTVNIGRAAPQLQIPSVAIRTPPGDPNSSNAPELWNVQLTLTAHVFAPRAASEP
jgi:hypothetical protein